MNELEALVVERAAADVPKELHAQIQQLTRDLAAARAALETAAGPKPVEVGIRATDFRRLETAIAGCEAVAKHWTGLAEQLRSVVAGRTGHHGAGPGLVPGSARPRFALRPPFAPLSGGRALPPMGDTGMVSPGARPSPASGDGYRAEPGRLIEGERLMLTALAFRIIARAPSSVPRSKGDR